MNFMLLSVCTKKKKKKFAGSVEFEIWTFVSRKLKWRHHDVITFDFYKIQIRIWCKEHLSGMPNFSLIGREVNRELWRNKVTNFNRARASAASNSLVKFSLEFCLQANIRTDTQTDAHTHRDKLQRKYNPSMISMSSNKEMGGLSFHW